MLTLKAETRTILGKKNRGLRSTGKMPAVMYSGLVKATPLTIDAKEFGKVWEEAGESTLVTIETPKGKESVLIHDVDVHPVTGTPLHADFYVVDTNKPVEVPVELEFTGVSPAVKNLGGILVKVMHQLEISVLPKELPHSLMVDLAALENLDSKIFVKDIVLPPSAKPLVSLDEVVVLVSLPKEEKEEVVVEAAPDFSAIEVEKKGKTEEATDEGVAESGKK